MSVDSSAADPLSIAQALIRCRSVTPAEGGALDYLQSLLEAHGFHCRRLVFSEPGTPDVDNLFARIGEAHPHLCFAGHTDVVPPGDESQWSLPPFAGEVRDGKLYGRGAADMKGGVAAFVAAVLAYLKTQDGQPPGSISFLITGDEEGVALNGTVKMVHWAAETKQGIDHCIVGEPTSVTSLGDTIKIGRRGTLSGKITVRGKQGHVAYPDLAMNPIPQLVKLVQCLLEAPLDDGTEHFQPSNLEFTSVDVGNPAWNVIPASAEARFNVRYNTNWSSQSLKEWIGDRLADAADGGYDYALEFEPVLGDVFLTKGGPLTDIAQQVVGRITGRRPELSTGGGTSDARFIKDICPVIELGLVGKTMHQTDEHIPVADLDALSEIYRELITEYFRHIADGSAR